MSDVESFGQALNKVECAQAQKRLTFAATSTGSVSFPVSVRISELCFGAKRRMDSAEKRKQNCHEESDRVTEEEDMEDFDPSKSICSGEWPSSSCASEDDEALAAMNKVLTKAKRVKKTSKPLHRNERKRFSKKTKQPVHVSESDGSADSDSENNPPKKRMKMKEGKERQSKPCPKVPQKHKEVKKWSTEEISLLIDLLEDRVCLWNVFDKSYHCREKRGKALKEIATELDTQVDEVKSKILILRTQLGREITKVNKTRSGQSTSELYKPNWVYWERLQFLRPVMQPGKSRDNLKGFLHETSSQESEKSIENEEPTVPKTRIPPKASKKVLEAKRQELLSTCINVLKEPQASQNTVKSCHFSLFIAEKLGKMDHRSRTIAEKRIKDVIFDIEINGAERQMPASQNDMLHYQASGQQLNMNMHMNSSGPYSSLLQL